MTRQSRRRTRNTAIIAFSFILIIVLGAIFVGRVQQTAQASGFVIKSIIAPDYRTENPNLKDYNWRIVANILGSERIIYAISPSEFQRFSGLATTNEFRIDMKSFDEQVVYSILRDDTIADFEYSYTKSRLTPDECPSGFTFQFIEYNNFPVQNVRHCLKLTRFGYKGTLDVPSVKFRAQMSLSAQNIEVIKDITSEDSVVIFNYEGENLGKAQWSGSLITGDPLPKTDDIITILQEGRTWYLITEDAWRQYQIAEANLVNIWESEIIDTDRFNSDNLITKLQNDLQNYKRDRDNYLNERTSIPNAEWNEQSDRDNAKLIYTANTRLSVPEIIFDIRADWVGIEILTGRPKIRAIECETATSGERNQINVDVENIGGQRGTFAFEKEACPSFKQSFSSITDRITLDADERDTKILQVDAGALNEDIKEVCTIKVYDISDPETFDTADVTCELERLKICIPNEQRSEGLCAYQCNGDGTEEELLFCCQQKAPIFDPVKEEFVCEEFNVEICGDDKDNDGDGEIDEDCEGECPPKKLAGIPIVPDYECLIENRLAFAFQILGILLVILAGIGSYYGQIALARRFKFKQNRFVFVIVALMISILLYILVFELWWLVLILSVIIGIVWLRFRRK